MPGKAALAHHYKQQKKMKMKLAKKKERPNQAEFDFWNASYEEHPHAPLYVSRDPDWKLKKLPYSEIHNLPKKVSVWTSTPPVMPEYAWHAHTEFYFPTTYRLTMKGW